MTYLRGSLFRGAWSHSAIYVYMATSDAEMLFKKQVNGLYNKFSIALIESLYKSAINFFFFFWIPDYDRRTSDDGHGEFKFQEDR